MAIEAAKRIKPAVEKALSALSGLGDAEKIGVKMREAFMALDADLRAMGPVQSGEARSGQAREKQKEAAQQTLQALMEVSRIYLVTLKATRRENCHRPCRVLLTEKHGVRAVL